MSSHSPILQACGLRKQFGRAVVLDDFNLRVGRGEAVGIVGPNGAGKTTALQIIAGILVPSAGNVRILGHDAATAKRHVGFLSPDTGLYRRLTPRETLRYFGSLHGLSGAELEQRIADTIADFDMRAFADRWCCHLSSGERQRASIARALVHDPDLLVLDEPGNALDIVSRLFTLEVLREAKNRGKAVLFASHSPEEIESLCDRIVVLRSGHIATTGAVEDLLAAADQACLSDALLMFMRPTAGAARAAANTGV